MTDDGRGQDLGHVQRRLPGQTRLVARQLPEVVGVEAGDGAQDGAVAGVVGGEGQGPRAEANVEILEQAGCGLGGALGIAASVHPMADFESVGARGAGNELPHAARALERGRARIEATFNHGEVDEIARQSLLIELAFDDSPVAAHLAQPSRHDGPALGVVFEEFQKANHLRLPAHGQLGQRQLPQPVQTGLGRGRCGGVLGAAQLARDIASSTPAAFKAWRQALGSVVRFGLAWHAMARKGLLFESAHGTQFRGLGGFRPFQGNAAYSSALGEALPGHRQGRLQRRPDRALRGQRVASNGLPASRQGQNRHQSSGERGPHGWGS